MSARVISLCDYRDGVRLLGLTLVWQGLRHTLKAEEARGLAEDMYEAISRRGRWGTASGFLVISEGEGLVLKGWGMGPIGLDKEKAIDLTLALFLAGGGTAPKEAQS